MSQIVETFYPERPILEVHLLIMNKYVSSLKTVIVFLIGPWKTLEFYETFELYVQYYKCAFIFQM